MESNFFSIVTDLGAKKMVEAINEKKKVNITSIAVGDGGGERYKPTSDMIGLKNEIWRGPVNSCKISEESENVLIIESIIPSDAGGFTIREMGAFDENGEMIMICNTPDTQKVRVSDGVVHELSLSMEVALSNVDSIQLVVDPNIVTASKKDIENLRNEMQTSIGNVGGYSTDKSYKSGEYCFYQNKMYKCKKDTIGEWDSEYWIETSPMEEIMGLRTSLDSLISLFGKDEEGNMRQLGEAAFAGIAHNFVVEEGKNFVAGADLLQLLKNQVDEQNS